MEERYKNRESREEDTESIRILRDLLKQKEETLKQLQVEL